MKVRLLALFVLAATMAHASLVNAGFESPLQSPGSYSSNGIDGWTESLGGAGVWRIPSAAFFVASPPEGLQIGYSNALNVAQQATDVLGLGTTKLTAMGGRRTDTFAGSFKMRLWAGGTVANGLVTGGTLLGEALYDYTKYAASTFALVEVDYTALPGDANLGQLLSVQFERATGGQMDFDDVRLVGPAVPEPVSLVVLSAGALALARRRRSN